jgi:hypothetical protein
VTIILNALLVLSFSFISEFHLILETLDLAKDEFKTRPLIQEMFNCALLNQRISEYAIIIAQFDQGLIGLRLDSHEKVYALYIILHSTLNYINSVKESATPPNPPTRTRSNPISTLADACQGLIEKIFMTITHPIFFNKASKEPLNARLSLCNQNLNQMYVLLK